MAHEQSLGKPVQMLRLEQERLNSHAMTGVINCRGDKEGGFCTSMVRTPRVANAQNLDACRLMGCLHYPNVAKSDLIRIGCQSGARGVSITWRVPK
jgi:hypothetical protein